MMPDTETICARCGAPITCTPEGGCWCMDLAPQLPVPEEPAGCLCPACLAEAAKPAS